MIFLEKTEFKLCILGPNKLSMHMTETRQDFSRIPLFLGRCVYASLVCTFRHGREEDEVMGVSFQKELIVDRVQVFPAASEKEKNKMQVGQWL